MPAGRRYQQAQQAHSSSYQVHLYFQKRLITYRVQDVDVTDNGEDGFAMQDGYYNFEVRLLQLR